MYNDSYAYKVEQLKKMRDFEIRQPDSEKFGAHLDHWAGCAGKAINLDADALQALIDHYERMDELEHYQAMKAQEEAEHPDWKRYEFCVDTYACATFEIMAPDKATAKEKTQEFHESDGWGLMYRHDCDFYDSSIDYIQEI